MKKVFIVGDWRTGTGPANVTKEYIRYFPEGTYFQRFSSKAMRLPELYIKIFLSDVILFSGYSYQNVLGMKLAKRLNKKTAYVVHGAITHENKINHTEDAHMSEVEEETLKLADRLYGVSKRFSEWLKSEYPQYKDKISYIMNGVDISEFSRGSNDNSGNNIIENMGAGLHNSKYILSIGGGMPRKRILNICKAVELLNNEPKCFDSDDKTGDERMDKYTLYVIGKDGYDTEAINKYDFVKDLGLVDSDTKERLFNECGLFIQNSCFETFGLAPVEALVNGMSILVSGVCGVLDIFKSIQDSDIINDCDDIEEIAQKIKYASKNPNNSRLFADINTDEMSWKTRSKQLYDELQAL